MISKQASLLGGKMSIPKVPRTPAWQGLVPQKSSYHLITDSWANKINAAIGYPGKVYQRDDERVCREGFYQFIPSNGANPLFLKIIHSNRVKGQIASNHIAEYLGTRGIPVSRILPPYPHRLNHTYSLLAYLRLDGRIAYCNTEEIQQIASLIAHTHVALKSYPKAQSIKQASQKRDQGFSKLQSEFNENLAFDTETNQWIIETPVQLPHDDAQVLHGDLNLGNIWVVKNKTFTLLDFEDSIHNYHSTCVDIAMLMERFIFTRATSDEERLALSRVLIDTYREIHPLKWYAPIAQILQTLSVRSLLLIDRARHEFKPNVLQGELEKFQMLYRFTLCNADLLNEIQNHG